MVAEILIFEIKSASVRKNGNFEHSLENVFPFLFLIFARDLLINNSHEKVYIRFDHYREYSFNRSVCFAKGN